MSDVNKPCLDAERNLVIKGSDTSVCIEPSRENDDRTTAEVTNSNKYSQAPEEKNHNNEQEVHGIRIFGTNVSNDNSRSICPLPVDTQEKLETTNHCPSEEFVVSCNTEELHESKNSFHWICFERKYKMSSNFADKTFCAEFTSKILVFKSIQFLTVASWTLIAQSIDGLIAIMENNFWTFFIALFVFIGIYLSARLTNIIKSIPQATCGYVLSIISLSHVCASIFTHFQSYSVPIILLTIVFSYIAVCIFCLGFKKVDVKRQDIFVPIVISTIIYSLISYGAIMLVHDPSRVVNEFGGIWLPSMMISLLVATGEMQEVQKLLHGLRLPLKDNEWIIATNNVL